MSESAAVKRPLPALDDLTEFFWTAGRDGVLRFLRCEDCATFVHPPQPGCPGCFGSALSPADVSGRATIIGWTVNHQPWHPAFPPPYAVAVVAMEDDPTVRLTTNIINIDLDDLRTGLEVQVVFEQHDDVWLPLFEPVTS